MCRAVGWLGAKKRASLLILSSRNEPGNPFKGLGAKTKRAGLDRDPMHHLRSSLDGTGLRDLPVPPVRGYDHRTLCPMPGSERGLRLQEVRLPGSLGDLVGRVVVTFRAMLSGPEVETSAIRAALHTFFGEDLRDLVEKPVAFGLVGLEAVVLLEDAGGRLEAAERAIRELEGVGSVETLSVDLV